MTDRPVADGYVVLEYFTPVYHEVRLEYVMHPTSEIFSFSEGWSRRESHAGLTVYQLPEYLPKDAQHTRRTIPWHLIIEYKVVQNSDEYVEAFRTWVEDDHKLGHPNGKTSFQCMGCLEQEMVDHGTRMIVLPDEGNGPTYGGYGFYGTEEEL